jgi:hypothetical protein
MKRASLEVVRALVTLVGVSSCQTTLAQDILNPAVECYSALESHPALTPLLGKVVLSATANATLEMQDLKSRPTETEKKAISQWATLREICFAAGARWLDQTPRWIPQIVVQANDEQRVATGALHRGELTYGEFNIKSTALLAGIRKRLAEGVGTRSDVRRKEILPREGSGSRYATVARISRTGRRTECGKSHVTMSQGTGKVTSRTRCKELLLGTKSLSTRCKQTSCKSAASSRAAVNPQILPSS